MDRAVAWELVRAVVFVLGFDLWVVDAVSVLEVLEALLHLLLIFGADCAGGDYGVGVVVARAPDLFPSSLGWRGGFGFWLRRLRGVGSGVVHDR